MTLGSSKYQTLIKMGLVTLPLDSGSKLAVGQYQACMGDLTVGENFVFCLISCYIYRTWKSIYTEGGF